MNAAGTGWRRVPPLYLQVVIAVLCGACLGLAFGQDPYVGSFGNEELGRLGLFVITVLKTLAIPLIFFAILDASLRTSLPLRQGAKLLLICLVNVTVAMTIGLVIMNSWKPGVSWYGHVDALLNLPHSTPKPADRLSFTPGTRRPFEDLTSHIPVSMLHPFSSNNVIGVVLLAVLLGVAFRWLHGRPAAGSMSQMVVSAVDRIYALLVQILWWVIAAVPLAVFGVLAQVVGRAGIGVLSLLWIFLAAIMLGLVIHACLYYPAMAWIIGEKSPKSYFGQGADAILTAVSCNSSLATVPVTLRCLTRMNISQESARLAACVGTNFNNDGITLYEAMAALFLAQAVGFDLPIASQLMIVLASVLAGIGVAGIPEAGLIVLPLVLSAADLPDHVITAAIPAILTVDWIIARARSGVNVMSDMLVAILLDAGRKRQTSAEPTVSR